MNRAVAEETLLREDLAGRAGPGAAFETLLLDEVAASTSGLLLFARAKRG